jgi:crotonobetainyl-CoA:carnitine CoA-transferase CaiB-like acyl-CoA transferase
MGLPLAGIRVVDFSRVPGPHCAKTLLDLGADVVKVEPPSGDLSRKAFPSKGEISGYYAQQNAGKRNLSIDLNVDRARDVVAKLCDSADVIVERMRVDLADEELGDERPILGATDGPFFSGPNGEKFASPMSLVGSMSFPFYLAAMRRPDLADDQRFRTPELRLRNLGALHQIVQDWISTFSDMESLDAQLDEAKIATGQVRNVKEFAASSWAEAWCAVRTVPDGEGGEIRIPGRPWHFNDQVAYDDGLFAARQGEHNGQLLTELGYGIQDIARLQKDGALIQPGRAAPDRRD